jgi:hypothetical protein
MIGAVNVPVFPACLAALPGRQPVQMPFALRTVKHSLTVELVSKTYKFESSERKRRQLEASQPVSDFDQTVEQIRKLEAPKTKRVRKGDAK